MGSRRKTGGEDVRLPDLTRRSVMAAATAAPVVPHAGGTADADDLIVKCASFVAIDIRIARLVSRWSDLETEAFAIPGWHKLSPEEQLARP
jgi:hypothetical protein